MSRLLPWILLPVSLVLTAASGCGGSASRDAGTGGQLGSATGGAASTTGGATSTTGGAASTTGGAASTTGGRAATGGAPSLGGVPSLGGAPSTGGVPSMGGAESSICALPQGNGGCTAYFPSFWHNPTTHQCESFVYGGCGGNANRFDTLAACQAACGGDTKPAIDACEKATDCVLSSTDCCGPCEPVQISDLTAVNQAHAGGPGCELLCGACPTLKPDQTATRRYFKPDCIDRKCAVVDIRDTNIVSCETNADCRLRLGTQCCEACDGEPVAVNVSTNFCPDGHLPCPPCVPIIPAGYASVCEAGRCTVVETGCTASRPCP